jgi:phospholipid/cholesterol/gamma-HCH transport system substrate-binding protein
MKEKTIEFTVGIFVFIGLALLAYMVVRFGQLNYTQKMYTLTAVFKYTNGVVVSAPVRCAGVEVGKVEDLKFSEDKQFGVDVVMSIKEGTVIRKDVKVVVNSLGIMGEKYIEFLPQSVTAPVLKNGDSVRGEDPISMTDVMHEGKNIAGKIDAMISGWSDAKTQENVKDAIRNIRQLTDEDTQRSVKKSLDNIQGLTGSPNRENLTAAIQNFKEFSVNANRVSQKLDDLLEKNKDSFGDIGKKTVDLIDSMNRVVQQVERGEGTVGQLIKDKEIGQDLKDFVKDIKANPWKLFFKGEEKKTGKRGEKEKLFGIF